MGPMKTADSFLEFCFRYPSRNSNVTRTVPINVEPCESLLGQVVLGRRRSFIGSFFFSAGSFLKQVDRSQMRQVLAQKSSNIDHRMSTGVDD